MTTTPAVVLAAVCVAGPAATAAAQAPPAEAAADRRVAAVEITGVTRLDRETVWETIGVKPGGRLRRPPSELGPLLEEHYRTLGYAAARAQVRFDEATGTLHVEVDEGVVAGVTIAGVRPSERRRLESILDLEPGRPFNDEEVADALRRLESATSGAFSGEGEPPYALRRDAQGVHLTLQLRRNAARIRFAPGGTGRAALINRVDGFAPGISVQALLFAPSALNPLELYAHANYAFAAERVRYAAGALRKFGGEGTVVLGYERHDFTDTDHTYRASGVQRLGGWHIFFSTFQDYYRRRGDEAFAFLRPSPRLQAGVSFRSDVYESQPIVSDGSLLSIDPPPNPEVSEGLSRSVLFTARWAWRDALFTDWRDERDALLVRDPYGSPFRREQALRTEATLEVADVDALGGVQTFRRFTGHARGAGRLSTRQWLMGRLTVGLGSDGLPRQRRFSLGGQGTLRGRARDDVEGDRMVLATAEWSYEPDSLPAVILFYDGGSAWDRGAPRPAWRHDAGLGLAWPPGDSHLVRVDFGLPLNAAGGERKVRVTGYVRLPL